jgi:large subunit ribosomal protein L13
MNKTTLYPIIKHDVQWYIIDAHSKTLGRLATTATKILLGKNSPDYNPSRDINHGLIIINADKIQISGKKKFDKFNALETIKKSKRHNIKQTIKFD